MKLYFSLFFVAVSYLAIAQADFRVPSLPIDTRIDNLISELTIEEKIDQLSMNTKGIPRLNIPPYDYWNEALHGVGRSGKATVFPQAIGLAATFDEDLIYEISTVISDEARAMYNVYQKSGNYNRYSGLTFWTPNVNIFRDPRWGRGQETYGEDPFLTSALGASFVKGLQGDHPQYLKSAACAKHFAVHSGPEKSRHNFDAIVSKKDMFETYLPAFEVLVDSNVESVMCAYNRTNGEPCCANNFLLSEILFGEWDFKGHVVSDCWALVDFYAENGHGTVSSQEEAAILALESGVHLNCGDTYPALLEAYKKGLIDESLIDERLQVVLKTRFKLGMFDPVGMNPFDQISYDIVDSEKHRKLAREAASRSLVLLKNNGILPLENDLNRYYVVGPNAASIDALLGNYFGVNPKMVTVLEGITGAVSPSSQVQYSPGTTLDRKNVNPVDWSTGEAANADVTIVVMGLTRHLEGEEGESVSSPYFGDRLDYSLPANQLDYLRKIKSQGKPVIAVVTGGSPMDLKEVHEIADAVLLAWYPGEEGGNAIADVLFGKQSSSGKLPITFPYSLDQLPPYEDYSMKGRTYRYMKEEPLYPFGFGLTYSSFSLSDIKLSKPVISPSEKIEVQCQISNDGTVNATEVVQLYISYNDDSDDHPIYSLKGIKHISLEKGESKIVSFELTQEMLELINENGESILPSGSYTIHISTSTPSERAVKLGATIPLKIELKVN